jgi:hypothetical protein
MSDGNSALPVGRERIIEALDTCLAAIAVGNVADAVELLAILKNFLEADQGIADKIWLTENVGERITCQ